MNVLEMRQISLINFFGFVLLLFLETWRPNWVYAWLDLRILLLLLLSNFVLYLIFINKNRKNYGK